MGVNHVFVLMLENRSFDHLLGSAMIDGVDPSTGLVTRIDGRAAATPPAPFSLDFDPGHEFLDVLQQLSGTGAAYPPGGPYPAIDNSGFAANAAARPGADPVRDQAAVMAAFAPAQLPVLNALAREFVVCDRWFSSLPGPTWPNRLFVHAATSGGLDDSPDALQSTAALIEGYRFANGTIFDRLDQAGRPWTIVEGDALPQSLSLAGMVKHVIAGRYTSLEEFLSRLATPTFADAYCFIEPHYGHVLADGRNFKCGNSQHPLDDVTRGEALIKRVYEAIRSSPHWNESLLIVLYDEHGGFYDHVVPPPTVPPGDVPISGLNRHGFAFDRLGVRVPAVIISPLIERNLVDHTVYEHASVPATLERLFSMPPMTARDAAANSFERLLTRTVARSDAPLELPQPAISGIPDCEGVDAGLLAGDLESAPSRLLGPLEPALAGFLHVAIARQLQLAVSLDRNLDSAIAREAPRLRDAFAGVETKFDAARLLRGVENAYLDWRAKASPRSH